MQERRFLPPILLALVLLLGTLAHGPLQAATGTGSLNQATQSRQLSEAEQLSAGGDHTQASQRYEALAAQNGGALRDRLLLKAASEALLASELPRAQQLLDASSRTLGAHDAALRNSIAAGIALKRNQPEVALMHLDQIPLPLPSDYASDILLIRAQALFALGRSVPAVNTALEREAILKTAAQLRDNHELIWKGLTQAARQGRDLTAPNSANTVAGGWLELARLYNASRSDPFSFNRALQEWRRRYPQHPGNEMIDIAPVSPSAAPRAGQRIALLLPLSGRAQAAGIAVRDGFLAAALQQPAETRADVSIYDTAENGVLAAYQHATSDGASVVVGPLLKEDVQTLAASQTTGTVTLALNTLPDESQSPALMFRFSLDPEDEARQAAQRALRDGYTRAIVLVPNNEYGQRMQRSFIKAVQDGGGSITEMRSYDPAARDHVAWVKQLFTVRGKPLDSALNKSADDKSIENEVRSDFDFIFLAGQVAQGRQVRPALRFVISDARTPVYSTSDILDPEAANNDLEGLRVGDMPWVLNRGTALDALYTALRTQWSAGLRSRSRLYAFGADAYALLNVVNTARPELNAPINGATGMLAVDSGGHVHRQLEWARIVGGRLQLLPENSTP